MNNMRKKLSLYKEKLDKIQNVAQKSIDQLPVQGRLRISHSHGAVQYYVCDEKGDTKGKYISKKKMDYVYRLAQKDYDQKIITCAEEWKKWIEKAEKTMPSQYLDEIYDQSDNRKELIRPYIISDVEYRKRWERIEYTEKGFELDAPEIYTEKGERVRSKSEKMIADKLYMLNIAYKYEKPIELDHYGIVYPDFTILNVRERKDYYLEHFGMMDNPEYCEKAINKINMYIRNGILPGKQLLLTFETSTIPIDMRVVSELLKQFF